MIPNNQYALYFQDTWRVNDKLMLDLGLRYDLVTGFAFDQDANIIFSELQAAGRAGLFGSSGLPCPCPGLDEFGQEPAEDKNNIAPRVGFSYDVNGDGRFLLRGGYGRYYDFAYTNANILFAVVGAQSSFGTIYLNNDTTRHQERRRLALPGGPAAAPQRAGQRHGPAPEPRCLSSHQAALPGPGQPGPGLRPGRRIRPRAGGRVLEGQRARHPAQHQPAHRRGSSAARGLPAPVGQRRTSASTPRPACPTTRARPSP